MTLSLYSSIFNLIDQFNRKNIVQVNVQTYQRSAYVYDKTKSKLILAANLTFTSVATYKLGFLTF